MTVQSLEEEKIPEPNKEMKTSPVREKKTNRMTRFNILPTCRERGSQGGDDGAYAALGRAVHLGGARQGGCAGGYEPSVGPRPSRSGEQWLRFRMVRLGRVCTLEYRVGILGYIPGACWSDPGMGVLKGTNRPWDLDAAVQVNNG